MKPRVQAILVADHVYEDKITGKKIIAGVFDRLLLVDQQRLSRQWQQDSEKGEVGGYRNLIPGGMQSGAPSSFICLTDVRGKQDFILQYTYVNEEQILFQTSFTITCNDPLHAVEIVLPLPPLPTDRRGTYSLELVWNNEVIGSHRIRVEEYPLPEKEEDNVDGE